MINCALSLAGAAISVCFFCYDEIMFVATKMTKLLSRQIFVATKVV